MKNKTKSEIVITFTNLDHANKLYNFLKKALSIGDMGGDLLLTYKGAEESKHLIGHDVKCNELKHFMYPKGG